ncbi:MULTISPECIES: IS110 family transposase [unclassified Streptomyces]|uniref:IS110 family transposase n=1 Tax=unclassified Streptomyces TaxID=2593676 RepID=UPI000DD786DA|nr:MULTISPECIES: IS110 family transposase [unclassified Streptomyces]QZZ25549.1 IS110 family transposase [Streptomyces sp. ST1015]
MSSPYDGVQWVGMDLHRRRSVLVRMAADGQRLGKMVRFNNDPARLKREIAKAGPQPKVVLEATLGWYWAADALSEAGAEVHLAHPLGVKAFSYRRVKNDERDAADLADLLRLGRLPEAWLAPPETRELRELVRGRHKLVSLRISCRNQAHGVMGKLGIAVPMSDLFGTTGTAFLDELLLPAGYAARVRALCAVMHELGRQIGMLDKEIAARLASDTGYRAIQKIGGIGPVLAAVFTVEIADVTRFPDPQHLCSWAGLTPRHRESDTVVRRGHLTKQGSKLVRWAAVEAVQHAPENTPMRAHRDRIEARRGAGARNIAKAAAARKLLTLVYYGLRDGEVRCLTRRDPV